MTQSDWIDEVLDELWDAANWSTLNSTKRPGQIAKAKAALTAHIEKEILRARIDELERTTWNDILDNDTKDKLYLHYLKDRIKTLNSQIGAEE